MHIASQNPPSIKTCQTYTGELVQMPVTLSSLLPWSAEGKTSQMTTFMCSELRASCYELNFRLVFASHHTPEEMIKGQFRSYIKKKKNRYSVLTDVCSTNSQTMQCIPAQWYQNNWNNQGLWQILDWLITNSQTHSLQTSGVKICLPQCCIKIPACVCTSGFKSHIESEIWAALKASPIQWQKLRTDSIGCTQPPWTSKGFSVLPTCRDTLTANSR